MSDSHSSDGGRSHDDREHNDDDRGRDHHHHDADTVTVAVVTVTSSRSTEEDPSGDRIVESFEAEGHEVVIRELIRDEFDAVQGTVDRLTRRKDTDVVVITGGTGITPDDVTPEAIAGLLTKELPGFGELFRRLSHGEIGTRAIGSRATAGVAERTLVFSLPGSTSAVRLGVEEVILPEIEHLVGLASRGESESDDETSEE